MDKLSGVISSNVLGIHVRASLLRHITPPSMFTPLAMNPFSSYLMDAAATAAREEEDLMSPLQTSSQGNSLPQQESESTIDIL
jgi:hypothetical protein